MHDIPLHIAGFSSIHQGSLYIYHIVDSLLYTLYRHHIWYKGVGKVSLKFKITNIIITMLLCVHLLINKWNRLTDFCYVKWAVFQLFVWQKLYKQ
jgi:hypothetical protein